MRYFNTSVPNIATEHYTIITNKKGYCDENNIEMASIERIYQYMRKYKAKGGDLYKYLWNKLKITNRLSIDERTDKINNREEFRH